MHKQNPLGSEDTCSKRIMVFPTLLPFLVRFLLGIMFLFMGITKMLTPEVFQRLFGDVFGITGNALVIFYWTVALTESIGGFVILLGKILPNFLYKLSLVGVFLISVMGFVFVSLPEGSQIWFSLLLCISILGLLFGLPMCPMGLTGYKSC